MQNPKTGKIFFVNEDVQQSLQTANDVEAGLCLLDGIVGGITCGAEI